jgi:F-type H+-transporting ATPase subunit delta
MSDRTNLYADAFLAVLAAEGNSNEVQDELFRIARVIEGNEELRQPLLDPHLPVATRQQIIEDLLQGKALPTTIALVSLVISTGRLRELSAVVDELLALTASRGGKVVAEVRTAVALTDDQKTRLSESLKASVGKDVDVVVIVDPSILGGVVTQIGDTVIDGSIRSRLAKLRESF